MKLKEIVRNKDQSWSIELPNGTLYPSGKEHQKWDDLQDAQREFVRLLEVAEVGAASSRPDVGGLETAATKKEVTHG